MCRTEANEMQIGQTRSAVIRETLNKLVAICAHNPGLYNKYYIAVLRYSLVIVIITRNTGVKADEKVIREASSEATRDGWSSVPSKVDLETTLWQTLIILFKEKTRRQVIV